MSTADGSAFAASKRRTRSRWPRSAANMRGVILVKVRLLGSAPSAIARSTPARSPFLAAFTTFVLPDENQPISRPPVQLPRTGGTHAPYLFTARQAGLPHAPWIRRKLHDSTSHDADAFGYFRGRAPACASRHSDQSRSGARIGCVKWTGTVTPNWLRNSW